MASKGRVYKVVLLTEDGTKERFFGSVKAIFSELTEEQLGCSIGTLYRARLRPGKYYGNERCVITRCEIVRIPHKNAQ